MSSSSSRLAQLASHLSPPNIPSAGPLVGPLLPGQVALITGAGNGIGRATALLFAAHGAKVVVSDLDAAKAQEVVKEIEAAGGEALAVGGNVMEDGFAERLVKAAVEKFGKINHIVNNAGFTKWVHNGPGPDP